GGWRPGSARSRFQEVIVVPLVDDVTPVAGHCGWTHPGFERYPRGRPQRCGIGDGHKGIGAIEYEGPPELGGCSPRRSGDGTRVAVSRGVRDCRASGFVEGVRRDKWWWAARAGGWRRRQACAGGGRRWRARDRAG